MKDTQEQILTIGAGILSVALVLFVVVYLWSLI
jgi:hypothetical protein